MLNLIRQNDRCPVTLMCIWHPRRVSTDDTLGGITNHCLIACSLSSNVMSAKNYQSRLMCIKVIVCNISVVFFETQCRTGF